MDYLKPYLESFEAYEKKHKFCQEPYSLYEPLDYLLSIGGKRIRPCLALMSHDLYQDNLDAALPVAMAVELFHNFSLMHDDIMDEADMRRGKETVHKKFDVNTAILSGDIMLIKAYEFLEKVDDVYFRNIMTLFNKTSIEVCEGQRMDMDFETRSNVLIPEYIQMISYKTSVLLAASMAFGAIVGGASKEDQHHIYEFGKNIGIAFQIQDDILDTYGDEAVGKKIGGDIIQNKKTYLYLKAIELCTQSQKDRLEEMYSKKTIDQESKVEEVKRLFDELVVREYARQVMDAYRDLAVSHITQLDIPVEGKTALRSFADYLIKREH